MIKRIVAKLAAPVGLILPFAAYAGEETSIAYQMGYFAGWVSLTVLSYYALKKLLKLLGKSKK